MDEKKEINNFEIWDEVSKPPLTALKKIGGGRLKGMTDINPQWRIEAATGLFGPCGTGWKYSIDKLWTENGANGEVLAFALVSVSYKFNGEWSYPVTGIGGSRLIMKESSGMQSQDEGYKMAVTDALGVALKALGFGAEIYSGRFDGSKYNEVPKPEPVQKDERLTKLHDLPEEIKEGLRLIGIMTQKMAIGLCENYEWDNDKIKKHINKILDTRGQA